MKLSAKEESFLKTAIKLGLLSMEQVALASALRGSSGTNIAQIMVRQGYLTPKQATQIFKQMTASATGQNLQPLAGATPAPPPSLPPKNTKDDQKLVGRKTTQRKPQMTDEQKTVAGDKTVDLRQSTRSRQGKELTGESIEVGGIWGDYQIIEEIGRGGMGVVYKAIQQGTKRSVALKVMITGAMAGSSQIKRFLREAKATAKLDHPNIVSVYAMGEEKGFSYFTMTYVKGTTFEDMLADKKASFKDKFSVLIKVARALQHAHEKKILHRDIKPSNILIDENGEPYLTDFGLAKVMDSNSRLTQTGQALGTPFYMSPEQAKGDKTKIGPASDVYSMGVMLYQTLTGKLPFTSETMSDLYRKILEEDPVPPREHDSKIPAGLQAICLKAMEKDLRFRYSSMSMLTADLIRQRKGKKIQASKFELKKSLAHGSRRLLRSPKLVMAIALAVVLTVAIAIMFGPSKDWEKLWNVAKSQYASGEYQKSLGTLNRIRNHPHPRQVEKLRQKIYANLEKAARACFEQGKYKKALNIASVSTPSKGLVKLKAQIQEAKEQYYEMRLTLTRLYELKPNADDLSFMGEKTLARGYFEDARQYYYAALGLQPSSEEIKKQLALTLMCLGRYRKAKEYYLQLSDSEPDVALGRAGVYYQQGQYKQALGEVKKIGDIFRLSLHLQAQALFIEAQVEWQLLLPNMTRWTWLLGGQQSQQELETIQGRLREIETKLNNARTALKKSDSNYLDRRLLNDIGLYLQVIDLERNLVSFSEFERMRMGFDDTALSPRFQVFIRQASIRFLIRNNSWEKAHKMCNSAIERFPWVADFYHMRSLVRFQQGRISESLADLEKSMSIDKWNFIPLENMSKLMYPRMTQMEFNEFFIILMNRFTWRYPPTAPQIVYEMNVATLRERMLQSGKLYMSLQRTNKDWPSLLHKAIKTDSPAVYRLLARMMASQYDNPGLQREIRDMLQKYPQGEEARKLQDLRRTMQARKKLDALNSLQRLLLKYAVLRKEKYEIEVCKMGLEGEILLGELLHDSRKEPMMRFLATRMMVATKKKSTYQSMVQVASGSSYPENLLAATALIEAGFPIDLPNISREQLYKSSLKPQHAVFYRMLLALRLSPAKRPEIARMLLNDDAAIVSLCAAYNFRRYYRLPSGWDKIEIEKRLIGLLGDKDSHIRALACRVLWSFQEIGLDLDTKKAKSFRKSYRKFCWNKYHSLMVNVLDDPAVNVCFAGVRTILSDGYIKTERGASMCVPQIAYTNSNPKVLTHLRLFYSDRTSSSLMKFWSAILLSAIGKKEEVQEIIENPENPFSIRIACASAARLCGRISEMESASFMLRLMQLKPTTFSDAYLKQMGIYSMGWNCSNNSYSRFPPGIVEQIHFFIIEAGKSSKPEIKRASVAAMLWGGKETDIDRLYQYFESKDINLLRATAASLAALTLRYRPKDLPKLKTKLSGYPVLVRKAAAYGCYELVQSWVGLFSSKRCNIEFEKGYDYYLNSLKSELKRTDDKTRLFCAMALSNAIVFDPCSKYYYEAALVFYAQKKYRRTLQMLNTALDLANREHPELTGKGSLVNYQRIRCLLLIGEVYFQLRQFEKARSFFEKLLDEYPFESKAYLALGHIWQQRRNSSSACEHYLQAYLCDPESAEALFSLAKNHAKAGRRQEAIETLRQYHRKFGLRQSQLKDREFISLTNDSWVKSLPR